MTYQQVFNNWIDYIDSPSLTYALSHIDKEGEFYPAKDKVFKAFSICSADKCKVIILGQDCYPQPNVATGLAFANNEDSEILSPSLQVIKDSVLQPYFSNNYDEKFDITLQSWAEQGVLLLNSALTIKPNCPSSHLNYWRPFISSLLKNYSSINKQKVYILFGEVAQTFIPYIKDKTSLILREKHPAFYARTYTKMPNTVFKKTNEYLYGLFKESINWYEKQEDNWCDLNLL